MRTERLDSLDIEVTIQHTHEYEIKCFEGNLRGTHIHDSFTTLEELLRTLPEAVAFDIELSTLLCMS